LQPVKTAQHVVMPPENWRGRQ